VISLPQYELIPHKERLRNALQWLSEMQKFTLRGVEEAAQRYDLSPLDEEFLLTHFVATRTHRPSGPGEP
jgi:hypothetical protein